LFCTPSVVTASNIGGSTTDTLTLTMEETPPILYRSMQNATSVPLFTFTTGSVRESGPISADADSYSISPTLPSGLVFDEASGNIGGMLLEKLETRTRRKFTVLARKNQRTLDVVIEIDLLPVRVLTTKKMSQLINAAVLNAADENRALQKWENIPDVDVEAWMAATKRLCEEETPEHFALLGALFESHVWLEICAARKMDELWLNIEQLIQATDTDNVEESQRNIINKLSGQMHLWKDNFDAKLESLLPESCETFAKQLAGETPPEWKHLLNEHMMLIAQTVAELRQTTNRRDALSRLLDTKEGIRHNTMTTTTQDRVNMTLLAFAVSSLLPVPGSYEMWLASTVVLWAETLRGERHVVVESPDCDPIATLGRFASIPSKRTLPVLEQWEQDQETCCLVHNATARKVTIDVYPTETPTVLERAIRMHPVARTMLGFSRRVTLYSLVLMPAEMVVLAATELISACFSYDSDMVAAVPLKPNAIFSLFSVDAGVHVCNKEESGVLLVNQSNELAELKAVQEQDGQVPLKLETVLHPGCELSLSLSQSTLQSGGIQGLAVDISHGRRKMTCEVLDGQVLKIESTL